MMTTVSEMRYESADETLTLGQRMLNDLSGGIVTLMCALGDRLQLFKALAESGPMTSADLAVRAGVAERYAREWLNCLTAAGYLRHDAEVGRWELPASLVPMLAAEGRPLFLGGAYQQLAALYGALDPVTRAFRDGGGVSPDAYGDDLWRGMERMSAAWFDHLLVEHWLPVVDGVTVKLDRGGSVADIGSGAGRALISLARSFPRSTFVGYDTFAPSVAQATEHAVAAGVADRVRFEQRDAAQGIHGQFDLITGFDVLHDLADPVGVLTNVRRALKPGGTFLLLEIRCSEDLAENVGPVGTILYGTSVFFCLPTSLAEGAPGYGTMGLPPMRIRELCETAGFTHIRQLPIENPFNILYEVQP